MATWAWFSIFGPEKLVTSAFESSKPDLQCIRSRTTVPRSKVQTRCTAGKSRISWATAKTIGSGRSRLGRKPTPKWSLLICRVQDHSLGDSLIWSTSCCLVHLGLPADLGCADQFYIWGIVPTLTFQKVAAKMLHPGRRPSSEVSLARLPRHSGAHFKATSAQNQHPDRSKLSETNGS